MLNKWVCGRCRISHEVGEDQVWSSFTGTDTHSVLEVEVHVLKPGFTDSDDLENRLEDIRKKLQGMGGEGFLTLHSTCVEENSILVITDRVVGQTLSERLKEKGQLTPDETVELGLCLAGILDPMVKAGLLQGVISPEWIVFPAGKEASLMKHAGFGSLLDSRKLAAVQELAHLAAPELKTGDAADECSDIYTLGAVLYEALTGQRAPIPDLSPGRTMVVTWKPSRLRDDIPDALDECVARCLHPERDGRYASVGEVLSELRSLKPQEPDAAHAGLGMEDALVGQTLGPYRLVERMGQGGMASVYRAYEAKLDRYVAVKVLPQLFARDPNFSARFTREAKAVAQLEHPNIVPIYNYGECNGVTYIAMQLVKGGTLKYENLKEGDYRAALKLMIPITRALGYAHDRGIIHRDVKPSNVLVREDSWPMLADFGLARMAESSTEKLTGTGVGMGTPMYMSPEQGQGQGVDHRTDIYSLGIMLYELVTGTVPFQADTPMAIVIKHMTAPMPMPCSVNPDLPEALESIILKATAKDPEDRYQTAEEMALAMERMLAGLPVPAFEGERLPQKETAEKETGGARSAPAADIPAAGKSGPGRKILYGVLGVIGACLLGVIMMGIFNICPPQGPWPQPPWCEGSPYQFTIGDEDPEEGGDSSAESPASTAAVSVSPTDETQVQSGSEEASMLVCVITGAAGVDDRGMFQAAWEGVEQAVNELRVKGEVFVSENAEASFEQNLWAAGERCDLIITGSNEMWGAATGAPASLPENRFVLLDLESDTPENTSSQVYMTREAAFMAGYLAAGSTRTGIVGTFGGVAIPPMMDTMSGFYYGVQYFNSVFATDVQVLGYRPGEYGTLIEQRPQFTNREAGKEMTYMMLDEGADIILPAAGYTGVGAAEGIMERGNAWVIGYNTDWTRTVPEYRDVIMTSIIKNVDAVVFEIIMMTQQGEFPSGTNYLGIESREVGLSELSASFTEANPDLAEEMPVELEILRNQLLEEGWLDQFISEQEAGS